MPKKLTLASVRRTVEATLGQSVAGYHVVGFAPALGGVRRVLVRNMYRDGDAQALAAAFQALGLQALVLEAHGAESVSIQENTTKGVQL